MKEFSKLAFIKRFLPGNCEINNIKFALVLTNFNFKGGILMAGKIKSICDTIIQKRSAGSPVIEKLTKTKLVIKGVNPDNYTASSPDDPEVINKLSQIAKELGVTL